MVLKPKLLALAVVLAIGLAGCTANAPLPTPSLTPPALPETILNPELQPTVLAQVTEDTVKAEGTRIADALQALIDPATILNIDDSSQLVAATSSQAAYYGVYREISLDTSVDCLTLAESISSVLDQSGWTVLQSTNQDGTYVGALSSGSGAAQWFAFVSGDASVAGQSVVTFTIGSPDIT